MKRNPELTVNPHKILLKLTVIGCFLMGFAYASLVMLNSALHAIH